MYQRTTSNPHFMSRHRVSTVHITRVQWGLLGLANHDPNTYSVCLPTCFQRCCAPSKHGTHLSDIHSAMKTNSSRDTPMPKQRLAELPRPQVCVLCALQLPHASKQGIHPYASHTHVPSNLHNQTRPLRLHALQGLQEK